MGWCNFFTEIWGIKRTNFIFNGLLRIPNIIQMFFKMVTGWPNKCWHFCRARFLKYGPCRHSLCAVEYSSDLFTVGHQKVIQLCYWISNVPGSFELESWNLVHSLFIYFLLRIADSFIVPPVCLSVPLLSLVLQLDDKHFGEGYLFLFCVCGAPSRMGV